MNSGDARTEQVHGSSLRGPASPKPSNPDSAFEQSILLCPKTRPGKIFIRWNTDLNCFDTSQFIPANITNDYSY